MPTVGLYSTSQFLDTEGRLLKSTAVEVVHIGTMTGATLYTDETGATVLSTAGATSTDSAGNLDIFPDVAAGRWFDLRVGPTRVGRAFAGEVLAASIPISGVIGLAAELAADEANIAANTAQIATNTSAIAANASAIAANTTAIGTKQTALTPTAVKTANYTAAAGEFVPVDTTSGGVTVTLPNAPADKTRVGVKMVTQGGTNTVTVARGGTDVFNKAGGSTSLTLSLLMQDVVVQYAAGPGIWYVQSDDMPLGGLDLRYGRVTQLPPSNGTDDLATINAALAAGGYVRGLVGQTYLVSGPPVIPSNTTLDMTGCTVRYSSTAVRNNLLNNAAVAPSNTATDVTTTAGSNVITSPALVAAGAAVGHQVGVVAAGVSVTTTVSTARVWLYGTITAVTGNNITLAGNFFATNADVSLTNATGNLYKTRDSNITVIGGTWDAGTNWNVQADRYNYAFLSNLLRFRRCDGLTVRDVRLTIDYGYASSGLGWCFGINPADCSKIVIERIGSVPGQAAPTLINSSGLIQHCVVRNIEGTSYDDMVAFGAVGAGGDDVEGDLGNIVIDGVFAPAVGGPPAWNKGSNRGVDLYCGRGSNGQQRVCWSFDVRSVKGNYNSWPVSLVSYPAVAGQAANFTGRLGDITGAATGKPPIFIGRADGTNAGLNTGLDCAGTVTGPNTGGELTAPAQITANSAATGPAIADVAGLSITFTAPPSGVVLLEAWAYSVGQIGSAGNTIIYITDSANNVVAQSFLGNLAAGGFSTSPNPKARVSQLVSGTSYTYKVRLSSAAGTQQVLAGATFPAFLRAVAA